MKEQILAPTGSTMLDLACSDGIQGGFCKGSINNVVGDSSSGKTILTLTSLACCAMSPSFDDYKLIYDCVERRDNFNKEHLFGKAAERIQPPMQNGGPVYSKMVQDWLYTFDKLLKDNRPFIYILDSLDVLDEYTQKKKRMEKAETISKGKSPKDDYGTFKARAFNDILRHIAEPLEQTESVVVIISQTRDAIGDMFKTKTRSGGRALEFYCNHILWMSSKGKIKKSARGKQRQIGGETKVKVTKNNLTGKQGKVVSFPIYPTYGVDDIGGMISFLVDEKEWKCSAEKVTPSSKITASTWEWKAMKLDELATKVIEDNKREELKALVKDVWCDIETSLTLDRPARFI